MAAITKPVTREIVDDFAKEIRERRVPTAKPSKDVINFRTEMRDGVERTVYRVPIDLLRFRKDNGRIASDVADYEGVVGPINERDDQGQAQIAKFLIEKDPERTEVLRSSVLHAGQQDPAIITCDGFLINGNRRKMVMDQLHKTYPENDSLAYMKCVILPGKGDPGGPPTLVALELVAILDLLDLKRKSEYYGFDRALSIKRKTKYGLSLEEQLRDEPVAQRRPRWARPRWETPHAPKRRDRTHLPLPAARRHERRRADPRAVPHRSRGPLRCRAP
jgi:hypothetical protein